MRSPVPFLQNVCVALVALAAGASAYGQPDGSIKWEFATLSSFVQGNILSSPSLGADGTVYIGVEVGLANAASPQGRLFALTASGDAKWNTPFSTPDWIDASPAVGADGTVYVGCWDGNLYAITPGGTKKWSLALGAFISASAAIGADGTIYVGTGDGDLCAVSPDGVLKWAFPTLYWIEAAPAIGPDGTVYIGSGDNVFYAINPDGTERWRHAVGSDIASSAAIAADGSIYVGSRDLKLYSFSADGVLRWAFETSDFIDASPVLAPDGTIYCATVGGRVHALRPDGSEKWRFPAAHLPGLEPIYSTPAVRADGSVVFGCSDAAVYALRPDGSLLWRTPVGDWVDTSPAIAADGTLYVGSTDKSVYALAGAAPALATDWPQFLRSSRREGRQPMGAAPGTSGRLVNLSVRTFAGADASTLTVGYALAGEGERTLLVRGVGPTLKTFGVDNVLDDPALAFFSKGNLTQSNEHWWQNSNATMLAETAHALGAFPLPSGSADAAYMTPFPSGERTVQVSGANRATGIALVELYDVSGDASARLSNVSARSHVGTGAGVLVAGFVVSGASRAILIRGIGPTLSAFGVSGALPNPRLRIYDSRQVLIAENDDWATPLSVEPATRAASQTYAFQLDPGSRDAVLVLTLPPGTYTAQVSGVDDTTGVGLVEVYEVR